MVGGNPPPTPEQLTSRLVNVHFSGTADEVGNHGCLPDVSRIHLRRRLDGGLVGCELLLREMVPRDQSRVKGCINARNEVYQPTSTPNCVVGTRSLEAAG